MELALIFGLGLVGSYFVNENTNSDPDNPEDGEIDENKILEDTRRQFKNKVMKNYFDSEEDNGSFIPEKYNQRNRQNNNMRMKNDYNNRFDADTFMKDHGRDIKSVFGQENGEYQDSYFDRPSPVYDEPNALSSFPNRRGFDNAGGSSIIAGVRRDNAIPNFANLSEGKNFTSGFHRNRNGSKSYDSSTGKLRNGVDKPTNMDAFYEGQSFDATDVPSAENDVNETSNMSRLALMERDIASDGNWSSYQQNESMTLGVIPDDQMYHNNMMPFYKDKGSYGPNSDDMSEVIHQKNELFSGRLRDSWQKKQETTRFFKPVGDMTYAYGTPNVTGQMRDRYFSGRYHQNETYFDPIRVSKGVNLGADEVGTHGNHSMWRPTFKTVDELHPLNQVKTSYAGRVIEGSRGTNRPIQAPVIKYRPDGFKETTIDDMLPTGNNDLSAPMIRPEYDIRDTNRQYQLTEYTGIAGAVDSQVQQNMPEHMRPKIKYSTRQNFKMPDPLQKHSKGEMPYGDNTNNINSFHVPENMRSYTQYNDHHGPLYENSGDRAHSSDPARTTTAETTLHSTEQFSVLTPNTLRGTTQPMQQLRTTLTETTLELPRNSYMQPENSDPRVYSNDPARNTIGELHNSVGRPMFTDLNEEQGRVQSNDARITMKDTTTPLERTKFVTPVDQERQRAFNRDKLLRQTMGELHNTEKRPHFMDQGINETRGFNRDELTRTTNGELFNTTARNNFMDSGVNETRGYNRDELTRTTNGELFNTTPRNNFMDSGVNETRGYNRDELTRTTNGELFNTTPRNNFMDSGVNETRGYNRDELTRTTNGELFNTTPRNNFMDSGVNESRGYNRQELTQTTNRELHNDINRPMFATPVDQETQRAFNRQELLRVTNRELHNGDKRPMFATPIGQETQRAFNRDEMLRGTVRELHNSEKRPMFASPNQEAQRAFKRDELLRATTRELHNTTKRPEFIDQQNAKQGQASAYNRQQLRSTTGELHNMIERPNYIDSANSREGRVMAEDGARTTTKETTMLENYVGALGGDEKMVSYDSYYRIQTSAKREESLKGRAPTNSGPDLIAGAYERGEAYLRDDNNPGSAPRRGYHYNSTYSRAPVNLTTHKVDLSGKHSDWFDPSILNQLDTNPYVHTYYKGPI